ncbi:MAG: hypothetical protein K2I66_08255, partial [Bacteroidales bacterium]|nr:hypothetical protein [Bacteroidales bacterium]
MNIGVPDTLLLRVENPVEGAAYRWQIPDTWKPIGCTTCAELRVETQETAAATRVYGVSLSGAGFAFDTVQVKGADTTILILYGIAYHCINTGMRQVNDEHHFDFVWYKGNLSEENWVVNKNNSPSIFWSQLNGKKPLLKYRRKGNNTCWSVTDEVVVRDSIAPIKIKHYDGCVNIGVPDTLLLRIENADARLRYRWYLPAEWEPIGETDRGELRVITHETQNTTRIYRVNYANIGPSVSDTVQVKGADTTLIILEDYRAFELSNIHADILNLKEENFDCFWYKGAIHRDKIIYSEDDQYNTILIPEYEFEGEKPIAQYRYKGGCWSVTDDVIPYTGIVKVEIAGKGMVSVHSGRIYVDVVSEGNHEVWAGNADTLRFVVKPSDGFYLDRIEIEDNEQVTVVPENEIKMETDGTFTFHSAVTWQYLASIDSISKENFRFIFTEKQHIIKDLGEHTVCWGDSVKMRDYYVRQPGWHYDTVDGEKARGDTVYQLYLHVNPTYRDTLYFLAERDSLPYIHGKDTIRQFGWTTLKALTVHGCDSVTYVRLDTLYIHREQHFYDTLHTCEGGALSWRGREITQTGDYADTVFDPYKGGTDSIHHLRADIYPTYREVHRAAVEADSLPYILGKDTIRQFGLTELHRYQTVHGCDSV